MSKEDTLAKLAAKTERKKSKVLKALVESKGIVAYACEAAGIPHRNIIAVQGPFSEELNKAVIREYEIDVMITKDSGTAGGFPEKISAAKDCQIPVIVIARPEEEGLSFEEILAVCREKMK